MDELEEEASECSGEYLDLVEGTDVIVSFGTD
jgi:hypothetical protein